MNIINNFFRTFFSSALLISGAVLLFGCDRQDGRITQLSDEITQLRQEVRHLRSLKSAVEKLDNEFSQSRSNIQKKDTSNSNTAENAAEPAALTVDTKSGQLAPELSNQGQSNSKDAAENTLAVDAKQTDGSERARLANAPVFGGSIAVGNNYLDDPYIGDKDAHVVVMAFVDFQSRASGLFYKTIFSYLKDDFVKPGKIRFIVRDFPLESNEHSRKAAEIANCAGEQGKFWDIFSSFFSNPQIVEKAEWEKTTASIKDLDRTKLRRCIKANRYGKEINADISDAKILGIKGTPSFFIAKESGLSKSENRDATESKKQFDGTVIRGAQPYPLIKKYINEALR